MMVPSNIIVRKCESKVFQIIGKKRKLPAMPHNHPFFRKKLNASSEAAMLKRDNLGITELTAESTYYKSHSARISKEVQLQYNFPEYKNPVLINKTRN